MFIITGSSLITPFYNRELIFENSGLDGRYFSFGGVKENTLRGTQDYTKESLHTMCRESDDTANSKALDSIRKVATLAVACMEQHGAHLREIK